MQNILPYPALKMSSDDQTTPAREASVQPHALWDRVGALRPGAAPIPVVGRQVAWDAKAGAYVDGVGRLAVSAQGGVIGMEGTLTRLPATGETAPRLGHYGVNPQLVAELVEIDDSTMFTERAGYDWGDGTVIPATLLGLPSAYWRVRHGASLLSVGQFEAAVGERRDVVVLAKVPASILAEDPNVTFAVKSHAVWTTNNTKKKASVSFAVDFPVADLATGATGVADQPNDAVTSVTLVGAKSFPVDPDNDVHAFVIALTHAEAITVDAAAPAGTPPIGVYLKGRDAIASMSVSVGSSWQLVQLYQGPALHTDVADYGLEDVYPYLVEGQTAGTRPAVTLTAPLPLPSTLSLVAARPESPAATMTVIEATDGAVAVRVQLLADGTLQVTDGNTTDDAAAGTWSTTLAEAVSLDLTPTLARVLVDGIEVCRVDTTLGTLSAVAFGGQTDGSQALSGEIVIARIHNEPSWVPVLPGLVVSQDEYDALMPVRGRLYEVI